MITKKNLAIFEINECDFKYFLKGAAKYQFPLIKNYFKKKNKITTFTIDKEEGLNLDPWVQWVTVHTGIRSSRHKIYRLGQKLNNRTKQIWDIVSLKGFSTTLWGLFNSNLRKKKNIDLFFPDPWSFTQKVYPQEFNDYLYLPKYYATNYPNIKLSKIIYFSYKFLKKVIFSKSFFYILKNFFSFIKIFSFAGLKSFNLYFFLDLISLEILCKNIEKKKSDFLIVALNSFAHYQHNFWDDDKFEFIYFWYLNEMIKKINYLESYYNSSVFYNGFEQKKIKKKYFLRAKNPKKFLKILGLNFKRIEPNMTTGAQVFFKNDRDKARCFNILKSIYLLDVPLFEVEKFKKNIFFKFNIYLYEKDFNIENLNLKNKKKYFNYLKKDNLKKTANNISLLKEIFNNVILMKSTSEHSPKGTLYFKNFKLKKKQIENTKIFNEITTHFS
jgi:hypothetical protein